MKCDLCKKNEAVLYIKDVEGHKEFHQKLCMDCVMKMSDNVLPALLPLASILGVLNIPGLSLTLDKRTFKCPHCKRTLEEIEKTHIVGCETCYKTFKDFIDPIIFTSGYALPYKGSYPKSLQKYSEHRKRLKLLKSQLQDAVNTEDFEIAAKVRDELKREKAKYKK